MPDLLQHGSFPFGHGPPGSVTNLPVFYLPKAPVPQVESRVIGVLLVAFQLEACHHYPEWPVLPLAVVRPV